MTFDDRARLLAPLSAREVCAVPPMRAAGLVTDGGRARYRRWALAGCPSAAAEDVVVAVADRALFTAIRTALARIPDVPVLAFLARNVIVVGVGGEGGWTGVLPALPRHEEPLRIIAIRGASGAEHFASVVAHEAAHAWLAPLLPPSAPCSAADEVAAWESRKVFAEVAAAWGYRDEALEPVRRSERLAASLAHAWGFRGESADAWLCARRCGLAGD